MLLSTPLFGLMVACSPAKTGDDGHETADTSGTHETGDSSVDSAGDSSVDSAADTALASLNGTAPEDAVVIPDFSATNRDGSGRGPEDLRGHPTALWFYPAANTGG